MGTQQVQDPPILQRGKALPWKQVKRFIYTLVVITLLFFIVGAIIWILTTLGIIHGPVFDKLFVIFNGLGGAAVAVLAFFGIVQFILSLIPSQAEQSATPSSTPTSPVPSFPTQQIIVQVSQTPSTPPLSPPPNKAPYRGIVSLPPPTDPKTIQQREKAVQQVYDKLTQPDITAMVLTGIGGAGKSTLAALVYNYAEEQGRAGKGPFTAEPLWLRIDPAVTMIDLTGNLVEALGKPLPDLSNLSPENQAVALFNALNSVDKPRLVILDQFENLLDLKTGYALSDRPGIGEWLDALNSQQCTCHILLTSRPFPQGTRDYPPVLLQEYAVGGLEEAEAIDLLRKQGVKGTEAELRIAFERCAGHALSLTLLATLMRTRNLSMATLLKDPAYTQLWSGNIAQYRYDLFRAKSLRCRSCLFSAC